MIKLALAAAATTVLLTLPALAMDSMECSEDGMMKSQKMMTKMEDGEKKTMAMKEMDMAKEAMTKQDMEACKMHMEEAMKAMGEHS
ncbi:MAG: hypothetical protein KDG89_00525 [Geminicoccaceae bacterium]|nr:hypothetical protein [Geminicoccaceae bacterium]